VLLTGDKIFQIYSNDPHILELCMGVVFIFCAGFATESCEVSWFCGESCFRCQRR
jgi:hypothetical protein